MNIKFDELLQQALETEDTFTALAHCVDHEPSLLQQQKLARLLEKETIVTPEPIRLAILSSCTVTHLATGIRTAALRYGINLEVFTGGFDQFRQEITGDSSPLVSFSPHYILFAMHPERYLHEIPMTNDAGAREAVVEASVKELAALWEAAKSRFNCRILQQTVIPAVYSRFGSFDRSMASSPLQVISELNQKLVAAAQNNGALIVDTANQAAVEGQSFWHDRKQWFHAKMHIAPRAAFKYGSLTARVIAADHGKAKKCLVLDLDNTLWGGVIGDDGVEGIALGQGSALGEAHLEIQSYAKSLSDRGIVLAVCSKNDENIALHAFQNHPEMLLKPEDIAVFVANWNDKATNIASIAERLNLGLDSFVLLDDNPVERSLVRRALPMVAVPELPEDPSGYISVLSSKGYFESLAFTQEDTERKAQYTANAERAMASENSMDSDDFLASLEMQMTWGLISDLELPRCAQLIGKTNQFNTTTRRFSPDQLRKFSEDPNKLGLWFRLRDRFGDNGLVSTVLLERSLARPDQYLLKNWVMSCRVFGREFENEIMNIIVGQLDADIRSIEAEYIPTPKNGVIADLFNSLGFRLADNIDEGQVWDLCLQDYQPFQTQIKVEHST